MSLINIFFHAAQKILSFLNLVLITKKNALQQREQRDKAVLELAKFIKLKLYVGISGVVFSKNRPIQLYTLLYTYLKYAIKPAKLNIIYKATSLEFEKAYKDIIEQFKHVDFFYFIEEKNFCQTLESVLSNIVTKNIFFLVDDIVFIRKVNFEIAISLDTDKYILSLRHSPHLDRSFTANTFQKRPHIERSNIHIDLNMFEWFKEGNEWSDPWSVDGQILPTSEVVAITKISNFSGPNTYEAALKRFNTLCRKKIGLCYDESKILNLAINRVQNEVANLSGTTDIEFLLSQWIKGLMIDTDYLYTHTPKSTHEVHLPRFKMRPTCPESLINLDSFT